ncbi:VOC family protein [Novosphingobium bradum]|uniref:VOC family protein n=1 Tax=Novosphingobium bradum TaxID=1737444 RepID=A0ABV7IWM4_9SPHN
MLNIEAIDHVAITVADIAASTAFYQRVLGGRIVAEHAPHGRGHGQVLVRSVAIGAAMLNLHQAGNGIVPVAARPTPGSADLCLRIAGTAAEARAVIEGLGLAIDTGPVARRSATGDAGVSIYFRDPDGNLIELMARA